MIYLKTALEYAGQTSKKLKIIIYSVSLTNDFNFQKRMNVATFKHPV